MSGFLERVALLALLSCASACGETSAENPLWSRRDGLSAARDGFPALGTPALTEAQDLARFLQGMPAAQEEAVRVLVEFQQLVGTGPQGQPIPPGSPEVASARADLIAKSQSEFLQRSIQHRNPRAIRYQTVPFLYLDMTRTEVRRVADWIASSPPNTTTRPYRIRLERERFFRQLVTPAPAQSTSITQVVDRLQFSGLTPSGESPVIAVIDDRICDESRVPILQSRLEDRAVYAPGFPSATASEPPYATSGPLSHGTHVALTIAASHPWPKILALRCDDGVKGVSVPAACKALDAIAGTWVDALDGRLCAVAMSLGEDDCASLEACSCWAGIVNEEGVSHANLLIQSIMNVDAKKIPIVLPSGNKVDIAGAVAFPACITSVVTVGATYASRFAVSDACAWGKSLDYCAPGYGVLLDHDTNGYPISLGPGTSISVPFVASGIAVLWGMHRDLDIDKILKALESQGDLAQHPYGAANPLLVPVPEIRLARADEYLRTHP